jgi:hypothetical protein
LSRFQVFHCADQLRTAVFVGSAAALFSIIQKLKFDFVKLPDAQPQRLF